MVRESLSPPGQARRTLTAAIGLVLSGCAGWPMLTPGPSAEPPPAPREFRAAWIATVANIDWPSRPGLPVEVQQAEIRRIVERAVATGLNALILQVRPAVDALYASSHEPWSEYLTGTQGRAPEPFYDPLAYWIDAAHRHGIELHAWFNPYRAKHPSATGPLAANHLANTAPGLVKAYGTYLWMDPGEPAAAERTLAVILDVVRRYDIDGVHMDDYFYPYPIAVPDSPAEAGLEIEFPDEPSWLRYVLAGGTLARADWRRGNVNALIERVHGAIHREKPWVRFGISPFGIGRPDRRPPNITGFSQYDKLYADVELWLANGWLDYFVPQLYWPIDQAAQAFGVLLEYWQRENVRGRHLWPGLFTSRINDTPKSWTVEEILDQVALGRSHGANGHVHFSMVALADNRKAVADRLRSFSYPAAALVPATPWLSQGPPSAPAAVVRVVPGDVGSVTIDLRAPGSPWLFAVWARYGADWKFSVVRGGTTRLPARNDERTLEALVVSTIDRLGMESERVRVPLPAMRMT